MDRLHGLTLALALITVAAPQVAAEHDRHEITAFDASGDLGDTATLTARLVQEEPFEEECPVPRRG
jgi:predicted secreted protein